MASQQSQPQLLLAAACCVVAAASSAAGEAALAAADGTTVFTHNEGHWPCTRIPSVILAGENNGQEAALLAFAECRDRVGDGCVPENPIVPTAPACVCMKRSTTNGSTWDASPHCVAPAGSNQPLAVFHRPSGTTVLHFNWNRTVHQMTSTDNGLTWRAPRSLAVSLTPLCASANAGPGRGVQLAKGPHAGRLVMVGWDKKYPAPDRHDCVWYSDDGGSSWTISQTPIPEMNEAQVAETLLPPPTPGATSPSAVYFNSRTRGNITGKPSECRASALSTDGGGHFALPVQWNPILTEPGHGCQGSVLGLPVDNPKFLFFSNPADESRSKMTVRRSVDAGRTWSLKKLVHPEGSAYSCMTELRNTDQLGLLHERDAPGCSGPSCQTVFSVLSLSLSVK
jgi:sialidase-1